MDKLNHLGQLIDRFTENGPAGAGVRVYKEQELIYEHFTGFADIEKGTRFNEKTICQLASMTKPIAAAACMQLFEAGEFLLTDPVEMFVPEFRNHKVYRFSPVGDILEVPAENTVRMGHTFDMTSGITINWGRRNPNSEALTARTDELIREGRYTLQEFAKVCGEVPGAFEAGEHFFYGQSHDLFAAVLEIISGMRFGDYLKKNVFDPLGMPDTFFRVPDEKKDRLAVNYRLGEDGSRTPASLPPIFDVPTFESACGGLYGTIDDYSKFAVAMTNGTYKGTRILSDNTIRLMAMNRLCDTALAEFTNPYLAGYGYGLGVRTRMQPAAGSNTSIGEFGWTGAWGTWVLMDPVKKITIVYMHQSMPNHEEYIHPRIRNIVYSAIDT